MEIQTSYEDNLRRVYETGHDHKDRTGIGRRSIYGMEMRFDLSDGAVPVPTSRLIFHKGAVKELLWIISGSTNIKDLHEIGVTFWDRWGVTKSDIEKFVAKYGDKIFSTEDKNFEDQKKSFTAALEHKFLNEIGPMYGNNWRNAPRDMNHSPIGLWPTVPLDEIPSDKRAVWEKQYNAVIEANPGKEVQSLESYCSFMYYQKADQLNELIRNLKTRPYSSRHLVNAWVPEFVPFEHLDPAENVLLGRGALSVCHTLFQCFVIAPEKDGDRPKLNLLMYIRSNDLPVGAPFNMTQYAVLLHLLAHVCDMEPNEFIYSIGDGHIYGNQLDKIPVQLEREIHPFPKIWINPEVKDIFAIKPEDIEIQGYVHSGKLDYEVAR